ncbi:CTLH/CRA C-terminal to lish motif domain-containing protein [Suillus discolor]|uniref:CTLH/CRA C-terminal to lish motif domain-containing protein n=1 Tax=Suillus discolor TaxID=1912936 RepID=A0A9P7FHC3_9AGAM|nr:CTLH/CRA C-terminal to lish motif domain-containing protein [Suillus discolor]KAG2117297.1 CTLH/CRA C-terminal to lish motif domain-containing protein [Suillus discolor]
MSSTKLNSEGVLLFEQPFVRVPYENYRKVFRATQRNIERELGNVQTVSNDLLKRSKSREVNLEDAAKSVDGMIGRVENLKRKLSELQDTAGKPTLDVTRERLQHLMAVETLQTTGSLDFSRWADTRLDRWLVDWALRTGRENTARTLAQDRNIETLVDIDLFTDIRRIELALSKHSCTEALAWCSENKTALRKIKSTLEFELRLQEYIELARDQKKQEAMAYSKKHLVSWQETHLPQIMQAATLLAIKPSTTCGPYRRLYDDSRWLDLIQAFRLAIYNLNSLPTEPLLNLALYSGLASLKLPSCNDKSSHNIDCPVCDPSINTLAREVPFSHHANSTIVCRISGKIMDEDNMPMMFPNGQVYSREALEDMAAKHNGMVTCQVTDQECEFSALKKVFIS